MTPLLNHSPRAIRTPLSYLTTLTMVNLLAFGHRSGGKPGGAAVVATPEGINHTPPQPDDEQYMRLALAEAERAFTLGEVPIGAVIVKDGDIVAAAHNMRELWHDPTAHAELIAIRVAAQKLNTWRLTGTTLYVTIEPCPMCAGAVVLARVPRLVYGARDPKAGAVESVANLVQHPALNHRTLVTDGVLAEECRTIMQRFFRRLRQV